MADAEPSRIAAALSLLGRVALAVGLIGTGVLGIIYADFDPQWQHAPHLNFDATALAYANGVLLIATSAALLAPPIARFGGYALVAFLLLWIPVLHLPRIIAGEEAAWLGPFEVLVVALGAWITATARAPADAWERGPRAERIVQVLFGLSLLVFGTSHFIYLDFTAHMIPDFIPAHAGLAAFTGAGHLAAGLSIACGVLAGLAASLLALMFSLFVLLLHVPRVLGHPDDRIEWTMLCHATALAGAAWLMAGDILAKRR